MFIPLPRATVLVASGPADDPNKKHLFVLLTHGLGEDEQVLIVSVCSVVANVHHDDACVLKVGDHPFIKHDSYVSYDRPQFVERSKIAQAVTDKKFVAMTPVSVELYNRICEGLLKSLYASPQTKTFLRWHLDLAC